MSVDAGELCEALFIRFSLPPTAARPMSGGHRRAARGAGETPPQKKNRPLIFLRILCGFLQLKSLDLTVFSISSVPTLSGWFAHRPLHNTETSVTASTDFMMPSFSRDVQNQPSPWVSQTPEIACFGVLAVLQTPTSGVFHRQHPRSFPLKVLAIVPAFACRLFDESVQLRVVGDATGLGVPFDAGIETLGEHA